ncbi:hypothetical protein KW846_26970 [Pseudomonas sp. PDM32]|uniref:hypothetical protein n=1 Tax=Pseudomonas sp. PDM32 TaxID=2854768 RepID=UPI001C453725|nr:hypothetical protein [Pseudomonas sp. PDM32]MBV7576366.1 hypothetical protein [Pseudomonas sp. PDM32]
MNQENKTLLITYSPEDINYQTAGAFRLPLRESAAHNADYLVNLNTDVISNTLQVLSFDNFSSNDLRFRKVNTVIDIRLSGKIKVTMKNTIASDLDWLTNIDLTIHPSEGREKAFQFRTYYYSITNKPESFIQLKINEREMFRESISTSMARPNRVEQIVLEFDA